MSDRTTTQATRWKIITTDGTVYAFTDHDTDLDIAGLVYKASVGYVPSGVQSNTELSPDNMDVTGIIDDEGISDSDILAGRFDYARVEVAIVDYNDLASGDVNSLVNGRLGKISIQDGQFSAELDSLAAQFSTNVGRVISPTCDTDLGSTVCGYALIPDALTVTSVTDERLFQDSGIIQADGYYNGGEIIWATGGNVNLKMDIKAYTVGVFELYEAMPEVIQIGDAATVTVGCDKTPDQCKIYGRYVSNQGFPHRPGMQTILEGPE